MNIRIKHEFSSRGKNILQQHLKHFNQKYINVAHWGESIGVYGYDNEDNLVGGVLGTRKSVWICIDFLWVDTSYRGSGIASHLMKEIEQIAIKEGCTHSLVDTFSFQALPFYEKCGYQKKFTLEGFPESQFDRHYLIKEMVPS